MGDISLISYHKQYDDTKVIVIKNKSKWFLLIKQMFLTMPCKHYKNKHLWIYIGTTNYNFEYITVY